MPKTNKKQFEKLSIQVIKYILKLIFEKDVNYHLCIFEKKTIFLGFKYRNPKLQIIRPKSF